MLVFVTCLQTCYNYVGGGLCKMNIFQRDQYALIHDDFREM